MIILIATKDKSPKMCGKNLNKLGVNVSEQNVNVNSDVSREINYNFMELQ